MSKTIEIKFAGAGKKTFDVVDETPWKAALDYLDTSGFRQVVKMHNRTLCLYDDGKQIAVFAEDAMGEARKTLHRKGTWSIQGEEKPEEDKPAKPKPKKK